MEPLIRIQMLGAFQARIDGAIVSRFRTRRVATLFAFLALNIDRVSMREQIGEMLWPEQEDKAQRHNVSQALFSLRRQIEPPPLPSGSLIVANQMTLQLNPGLVVTDVGDFEKLQTDAARAESDEDRIRLLKEAINTYKGDLLPGMFEDWVLSERQRLEDQFVCSLRDLIQLCAKASRWDDAILYTHIALAREPFDESLHLLVMRAFMQSGRPGKAIEQYRQLKQLLKENLQIEPSEEARNLAKQARLSPGMDNKGKLTTYTPLLLEESVEQEQEPDALERQEIQIAPSEGRIPVQVTRFFGRQDELGRITGKLIEEGTRLISLLGPAGIGKTRLAVELSRSVMQEHGWNAWFVPLADVSDSGMILDAVAEALKVTHSGAQDPLQSIKATLSRPKTLLILDNFEQLDDEASQIIQTLITEIRYFACLVTTRRKLKIEGEQEILLEPLPITSTTEADGPPTLTKQNEVPVGPSIQMFVDRCQSRRVDFQLTPKNRPAIEAICSKLEGIPLAIELAAGLSNVFSPAQLLAHLDESLTLLVSRRRDVSNRHRSLRAAIDTSIEHLSPDLQSLFFDLSVFRGSFTAEAAAAVCLPGWGRDGTSERQLLSECMSMLFDLDERSLVRTGDRMDGSEAGFRILETFRQYGEEQVGSERHKLLRSRHAQFFLARCQHGEAVWGGLYNVDRAKAIRAEYSNHVAAVSYLFEQGRYADCITLLIEMRQIWTEGGIRAAERSVVLELLQLPNIAERLAPVAYARLLCLGSTVSRNGGDHLESRRLSEKAMLIATQISDHALIACATRGLAMASEYLGEPPENHLRWEADALEHALLAADDGLLSTVYNGLGTAYWRLDENESAALNFEAALKHNPGNVLAMYNQAYIMWTMGREEQALSKVGDAVRKCKKLEEPFVMSLCYSLLARYYKRHDNFREALRLTHDVLVLRGVSATPHWVYQAILEHASLLTKVGLFKAGTMLLASAQNKIAARPGQAVYFQAIEDAREALSADEFGSYWAQGLLMDITEAFDYAVKFR